VLFRRLFARRERFLGDERTDFRQLENAPDPQDALQSEYERLITSVVRRWGVPESCASVEMVRLGEGPDGRQAYFAVVRIFAWDRRPALRLLLGLPLLERKVRKTIRAHWVSEVSHFGGVWLHASERLADTGAATDLRPLLATLTHTRNPGTGDVRASASGPDTLR